MSLAFTRRQMEVLALIRLEPGITYPKMADRLGCAPETVRIHVQAIAAKLPWQELPPRRAVGKYVKEV